jgi:ATP-dependent HslUV protease subunit HslV
MTTLVYRAGVLAADSRSVRGDTISPYGVQKIRRLDDGTLVGMCGTLADVTRFIEAYSKSPTGDLPELPDSLVLVVKPNGRLHLYEESGSFELEPAPFYAFGSGQAVALGALYAGASAVQAVEIAAKVDRCTGGDVRSVHLVTPSDPEDRLGFGRDMRPAEEMEAYAHVHREQLRRFGFDDNGDHVY